MKIQLDPYFEEFFTESLVSYFDILSEQLNIEANSNVIDNVLRRYIKFGKKPKLEEVIKFRDNFMKNQENRDLLKSVKQRKILRIYREYFGPDYIRLRDDIINSAITLFLKIALDFTPDIRELFL